MSGRERVYRAEGIVLRRRALGEADRLLTVFSREFGKIALIAKGARRPSSRKAGHLEIFTHLRLVAARGRDLDVLTQVDALDLYPTLRADLDLVGQASYLVELVDRFTVEREAHEGLFNRLVGGLEMLDQGRDPHNVIRFFELRLLESVGYRPELFSCVGCGQEVRPEAQFFSFEQGGILCRRCGGEYAASCKISLPALKVLRHVQRSPYSQVESLKVGKGVRIELDSLMEGFFTALLERHLNTPDFIREVRRVGGGLDQDATQPG
jgi:DNA repair protein RecO (recombination protein O)